MHRNSQDAGSFRVFSGEDFHPMSDPQMDNPSIRLRFGRSDPKYNAVSFLKFEIEVGFLLDFVVHCEKCL